MSSSTMPWRPTDATPFTDVACLNYGGDLWIYAQGFRQAAEILLAAVRKGEPQDFLVYPIVLNARHAVELALKQVIREGRRLIDEPGDFPDGHRLHHLWVTCKPILKRIWSSADFTTVDQTIRQLELIDPDGESFRYPVSRRHQGTRRSTLPSELTHLDLGSFTSDIIEVLELLDGADTGIDVYMEHKRDMEYERRLITAEIRAEYASDNWAW